MTAEDQTRPATRIASLPQRLRLRRIAGRVLLRTARPHARRHAREVEMAATLGRLQDDFEHVRERHTEQIERLEDLVRELVLAAESLRRGVAQRENGSED
jgi:hypothetical protein